MRKPRGDEEMLLERGEPRGEERGLVSGVAEVWLAWDEDVEGDGDAEDEDGDDEVHAQQAGEGAGREVSGRRARDEVLEERLLPRVQQRRDLGVLAWCE